MFRSPLRGQNRNISVTFYLLTIGPLTGPFQYGEVATIFPFLMMEGQAKFVAYPVAINSIVGLCFVRHTRSRSGDL